MKDLVQQQPPPFPALPHPNSGLPEFGTQCGRSRINPTSAGGGSTPSVLGAGLIWRHNVVYVAPQSGWWTDKVIDHLPPDCRAQSRTLAERLGLAADLFDAAVARLSTGEKQRLALVRALVSEPPVLLLDEPTAALDERSVILTEALLRERLANGTSIVLVTHDSDQALRLGTQRYRMAAGKLEAA